MKRYVKQKIYEAFTVIAAAEAKPYNGEMITPAQIRAARALLGWKQTELAAASGVSEISIKNIERGATDPRASTLTAIESAFEVAGVIFLDNGVDRSGGPGLRLRGP